jgi:tripartite-type tricarboxylate transporter receptor subunit TctC
MAHIRVEHVPFRGGSPALQAVLSGQVHYMFSAIVAGLQQARAGRVRALAVTSAKRSRVAPDMPTVAEAGVPGYRSLTWYGLLAPAGTPAYAVSTVNAAAAGVLRLPEVREKLLADGAEPAGGSPADFARQLASEIARFNKLATEIGLKAEKAPG